MREARCSSGVTQRFDKRNVLNNVWEVLVEGKGHSWRTNNSDRFLGIVAETCQ